MAPKKNNILKRLDWLTIVVYILLIAMGWLNIYSAVFAGEQTSGFELNSRYGKQLLWIAASVVIIIIALLIDSKFYSAFAYPIYLAVLLLLVSTLVIGTTVNGAKSWIVIGPISFQPAEFAKIAAALALSKFMSKYNFNPKQFKTLLLFCVISFLPSVFILLQNDTGSALVFFVFFLVYYREGMPWIYLFIGLLMAVLFVMSLLVQNWIIFIVLELLAFVTYYVLRKKIIETLIGFLILTVFTVGLFFAMRYANFTFAPEIAITLALLIVSLFYLIKFYEYKFKHGLLILSILIGSVVYTFSVDYFFNNVLGTHQQERINNLLGIEFDPYGAGYNVNQSMIAIGSGGPFGKGYLQGTQTKFKFVPEQSTDFIFCTVGEEWGFIGSSLVIILFLVLLLRIVFLAERQKSKFSRIFGYAVASILFFHVAINVGMTIGLVPVIGIPLPFFSYGGSSLWGFTLLLFMFLKLDSNRTELIT